MRTEGCGESESDAFDGEGGIVRGLCSLCAVLGTKKNLAFPRSSTRASQAGGKKVRQNRFGQCVVPNLLPRWHFSYLVRSLGRFDGVARRSSCHVP